MSDSKEGKPDPAANSNEENLEPVVAAAAVIASILAAKSDVHADECVCGNCKPMPEWIHKNNRYKQFCSSRHVPPIPSRPPTAFAELRIECKDKMQFIPVTKDGVVIQKADMRGYGQMVSHRWHTLSEGERECRLSRFKRRSQVFKQHMWEWERLYPVAYSGLCATQRGDIQ